MVFLGITAACTLLEPLFAALLKRVNTSVEVEDGAKIDSLDLTED